MESQTYIKNVKVSPKKLRFIIPDVKRYKPAQALNYLYYTEKKTAKILYKAIQSAISNARSTLKVQDDMLKFKLLTIEEGYKLKRYKAGGRGRPKPYKRRFSHIKISLVSE